MPHLIEEKDEMSANEGDSNQGISKLFINIESQLRILSERMSNAKEKNHC